MKANEPKQLTPSAEAVLTAAHRLHEAHPQAKAFSHQSLLQEAFPYAALTKSAGDIRTITTLVRRRLLTPHADKQRVQNNPLLTQMIKDALLEEPLTLDTFLRHRVGMFEYSLTGAPSKSLTIRTGRQ